MYKLTEKILLFTAFFLAISHDAVLQRSQNSSKRPPAS